MIKGIKKAVSVFNNNKGVARWVEYDPSKNAVYADWDIDFPVCGRRGYIIISARSLDYWDISMKTIRNAVEDYQAEPWRY